LPVADVVTEYEGALRAALDAPSDDCVRTLAGEGRPLREQRDQVRRIRDALSDQGLQTILSARKALSDLWPSLDGFFGVDPAVGEAAEFIQGMFQTSEIYTHLKELREARDEIEDEFKGWYEGNHQQRTDTYRAAIDDIQSRPEWAALLPSDGAPDTVVAQSESVRESILADLRKRICSNQTIDGGACRQCAVPLSQLEADIDAAPALKAWAIEKLREANRVPEPDDERPVHHLRLSDLARGPIEDDDALDDFIERAREQIGALLATGGRVIVE